MARLLLLLLSGALVCSAEGGANFDEQFREWLTEHKEVVAGLDPEDVYSNWLANARFVEEHNSLAARGVFNYRVALNAFAHKKLSHSSRSKPLPTPPHTYTDPSSPDTSKLKDIPSSVDWRDKGVIHPVSDQEPIGESAGGYALVRGAIDAFWAIQHGKLVTSSMKEYENCCGSGGMVSRNVYDCIVGIGGLALESEYPSNSTTCQSQQYKPTVTIKGGKFVPEGDEVAMAEVVAMQPVAVGVDASAMSFKLYKRGVYSCLSNRPADHMMVVVGYGTHEGVNYWLCQNSWGASWGMDGYIMIAKDVHSTCGIANYTSYPF